MDQINDMEAVRRYDREHFVHPWEYMPDKTEGLSKRTFVEKADGIYVYDERGNRYIDGPGGMWCMQIGYGRQDMIAAIADQMTRVTYFQPWGLSSSPSAILARKIAERAPGDLNHVSFTTGGSTAVDTALRFMHFYNNVKGRREKKIVISRQKAYHGSTYLSASVSGKERDKNWFDTDTGLSHFLPDVNPYRRPKGMSIEDFLDEKVADLENAILKLGADKVGAFIAEPILASGGVVIPPDGYHKRCLDICRKHDVLYISDEVVTGFGRLGHWFASEDVYGIQPDMITCAKGLTSGYLPMGACIISDRIFSEVSGDDAQGASFSNGFTYSGHPASAAAALKNIEIFEDENILEHVREITPYFQEKLQELSKLEIVGDARGVGLVGCIECVGKKDTDDLLGQDLEIGSRIDKQCQKLGLIVRPLINMCVFSPPLIITRNQIDEMFAILRKGIEAATEELRAEGLV